MRLIVWLIWCGIVGALISAFGPNVVDDTIWFLLIDGALLFASWHAFNIIWPTRLPDEQGPGED